MYFEEEINVVGIIPEQDLFEVTTKPELERIIYDALGLGPIYEPLILDLTSKDKINLMGEIE